MSGDNAPRVHVSPDGMVRIAGVRVFRYMTATGEIQFLDKDGRRSADRGDCFVYVALTEWPAIMLEIERQAGVNANAPR